MKKFTLLFIISLIISATSCSKDDDSSTANFKIKKATSTTKSTLAGTYAFTKVLLGVDEIDFELTSGSNDQDYKFEGNFEFNVLTGISYPSLNSTEIEIGVYHELEINVSPVLSTGNAIEINGTYTDGDTYTFEFTSKTEEDFDIQNTVGISANAEQTVTFVLYVDLEKMFTGVDLTNANVGTDNIIHIDALNNSNLADAIEDNLEDAFEFDDDDN